ncbi:PH domain-like protein [Hypomontagnella monticulosa]|nr:PH domain-like protein [Hypomontagnella monticulosa]
MSQTPRRHQNRGHQSHPSFSQSPHSHAHTHSHSQQHHQQQQHGHTRNRSQQLRAQISTAAAVATPSDYESDTAHYMAAHPPPPTFALASRTNTELNLGVLRRYRPSIASILSIAANCVVYTFTPPAKWDKSHMEGTLFVCVEEDEHSNPNSNNQNGSAASNGCLFILNRKGLQNLVLDLADVGDFELADGLLIFKLAEDAAAHIPMENGEVVRPRVLGMWIYAEDEQDRRTNSALVHDMWIKARAAREEEDEEDEEEDGEGEGASAGVSSSTTPSDGVDDTPVVHEGGRQVSLNELFGRTQNGIGGS